MANNPLTDDASDRFVEALALDAIDVAAAERRGERGKNAARFKRGELMTRMADMCRSQRLQQRQMLQRLNTRALELAEQHGLMGFESITESEATTTRRVVEVFGSSGEFELVNAISPVTGQPLVDDSGNPPLVELTDVAINKLYCLIAVDEDHMVEALSFAYRNSEKVVRKAKNVAEKVGKPLHQIIALLDAARVDGTHQLTGEAIEVQPSEADALRLLAERAGEERLDLISIKTDRGFYDSFYLPMKRLMSAVASIYAPQLVVMNGEGLVSNAYALEVTLAQYFNPSFPEGASAVLGAMVRAETLTEAQAEAFLESHALNPETGDWVRTEDLGDIDFVDDDDWGEDEQ